MGLRLRKVTFKSEGQCRWSRVAFLTALLPALMFAPGFGSAFLLHGHEDVDLHLHPLPAVVGQARADFAVFHDTTHSPALEVDAKPSVSVQASSGSSCDGIVVVFSESIRPNLKTAAQSLKPELSASSWLAIHAASLVQDGAAALTARAGDLSPPAPALRSHIATLLQSSHAILN